MTFANNAYLLLLLLTIPMVVWYILRGRKRKATLMIPTTGMFDGTGRSWKTYLLHLPFILELVAFSMLAIILARPQTTDRWQDTEIEGI
ncbi:MAG: BatA domain-containing protein, partial [Bacteroidaceae bacterium]|nr:BatA domain-containing protein [Bacteroidaceae bacterium]